MIAPAEPLSFAGVDNLAFGSARKKIDWKHPVRYYLIDDIGPLFELLQLSRAGVLPKIDQLRWVSSITEAPIVSAMLSNKREWVCPHTGSMGFFRLQPTTDWEETRWIKFCLDVRRACIASNFPTKIAAQFLGALGELRSNIYEHSNDTQSGLIAYQQRYKRIDFVVADDGIGLLNSLKTNSLYGNLDNYGDALELALTEGCSRFGNNVGRGYGFRPLFVGLANLHGKLRFRSGDHALIIDGDPPSLMNAQKAQKTFMPGFFISLSCKLVS